MKYVWKALGIYVAFLLQSLIFENLRIFSCSPDILAAVVIIVAVSEDFVSASILGGFAGLLYDVMYGEVFGISILLYTYLALLVGIAVDRRNSNSPLIMSWVSFVSIASLEIVIALFKTAMGNNPAFGQLCANILVNGLFGALFALCFVLVVQYIKRKKVETSETTQEKEAAE